MTLCEFLNQAHVRVKMAGFRPKMPRVIDAPLQVTPRSERYALIGTAFDYLLRFEIKRRVPHAVERRWVASTVADGICQIPKEELRRFCALRTDFQLDELKYDSNEEVDREIRGARTVRTHLEDPCEIYYFRAVREVVNKAEDDIAAYRANRRPSIGEQKQAAYQALRLAKIDAVKRAAKVDATFEQVDRDDIEELVELLGIVPWNELLFWEPIILNPTLGSINLRIGTDADLICGDCLIDIKTTKKRSMEQEWLDQLLVYFLLSRLGCGTEKSVPRLERFGFYFARHGLLWQQHAQEWTDQPAFAELERWIVDQLMGARLGASADR